MSLAERYDEFYKTALTREEFDDIKLGGWPRNRAEAIMAFAGHGETVFDVGCGGGHLLYQLRGRFNRLVGLEYSAHRLEQAKLNLSGLNFTALQGSVEAMTEVDSNSVECMVSADTIEHVPDVYLASAEMFRVLRPGGRLIINTPNVASLKRRALLLAGRFPSTSQRNEGLGGDVLFDGGHLHYFTFRSLALLLERSGFKMQQAVGFGRLGRAHQWAPRLLSGGVQWVAVKPA
jgi:SAM-dependent methyltransferase